MNGQRHVALASHGLLETIRLCLQHSGQRSLMIICSTKQSFVAAFEDLVMRQGVHGAMESAEPDAHHQQPNPEDMLLRTPLTLRSIAVCRSLTLAFCPDLPRLRAYLAHLTTLLSTQEDPASYARLVIVNMLSSHVSTVSWSAQGLNRTMAAAIDTATALACQLLLSEDARLRVRPNTSGILLSSSPQREESPCESDAAEKGIWDEDVQIIDSHTRTFGNTTSIWSGRRVTIRQIVRRWLEFDTDDGG